MSSFPSIGTFTSWSSPVPSGWGSSSPLPTRSSIGALISIREVLCGRPSSFSAFSSARQDVLGAASADVAVRSPAISLCIADQISSIAVAETLRAPSAIAASSKLRTSSVATMALNEIIQHGRISSLESWDKAIIRAALRAQPPLQAPSAASQKPGTYMPLGTSTCVTESLRVSPALLSDALPVRGAGSATPVFSETVGDSPQLHRWQLVGRQHVSGFKPAENAELLKLANRHLGCDESDSDSDSDSDSSRDIDPSQYFEQSIYGGLPCGDDGLIFQIDDI